jgi:hypothetical protein
MGSYTTLRDYLHASDKPFSWEDHNCLSFTSGALRSQGKEPLPEDWQPQVHTPREALLYYSRWGKNHEGRGIVEELDEVYPRVLTLSPKDGFIVARESGDIMGHSVGVTYQGRCIFIGERGLVVDTPKVTDKFWET